MQIPIETELPTGQPEQNSGQPEAAPGVAFCDNGGNGKPTKSGSRSRKPTSPPMSAAGDDDGNGKPTKSGNRSRKPTSPPMSAAGDDGGNGKPTKSGSRSRKPTSPPMSAAGDGTGTTAPAGPGAGGIASLPRPIPRDCRDPLALARGGLLFDLLSLYLEHCSGKPGTPGTGKSDPPAKAVSGAKETKKAAPVSRFPNLAGFCRFLGVGMAKMEQLAAKEPEIYDSLCAVFEDEALNSGVSASVLTPYFKKRLGYAEKAPSSDDEDPGGIRLIFDHDIWEDGA